MSAMLREAGLLKELEAAKERIRQLEAQSVPVAGEPVAWLQYRDHSGMRPTTIHLCDSDSQGAFEVVRKPTHSITAAELATLREKAAMADELQKRAERMQKALSDIAEWTDRYTTPGHPVSTIARAAIAQEGSDENQHER